MQKFLRIVLAEEEEDIASVTAASTVAVAVVVVGTVILRIPDIVLAHIKSAADILKPLTVIAVTI